MGELTKDEAYSLARELSKDQGQPASIDAIVRESGQSPFFIRELIECAAGPRSGWVGHRSEPTPTELRPAPTVTLDAVIRARTSHLDGGTRRLLQVVAVFGAPLDVHAASEAADLSEGGLDERTALRAAHLTLTRFVQSREKLEVYHDRIRAAVVTHLSPLELRQLHGRLATVLAQADDIEPETLVTHFQGAGDNDSAATYAVRAGHRAREAMAFDRAAGNYRFALACGHFSDGQRHDVERQLGDVLSASGRGYEAAQAYLAAATPAPTAVALELRRRAAEQLLQSGYIDEGIRILDEVLREVGLKLAASPMQALMRVAAQRLHIKLRGLRFHERQDAQLSADVLMRVDICWSVATGLGIVDNIRAAEFQARHLRLALAAGEPSRILRALAMEVAYSSIGGISRERQNQKLLAIAERLAPRVDHPEAVALLTVVKGSAAYMQGRWRTALDLFEDASIALRERCTAVAWLIDTAHFYAMLSLLHLGELHTLSRRLPVLLREARERDAVYVETNLRTRILYVVCLAGDDPEQAVREVRDGMTRWSQRGFHFQHYGEMLATTEIALYAGRGPDAWSGVTQRWGHLRRSLLLRVQSVRIESLFLRARAALAAAADPRVTPAGRLSLTRSAARDARRLVRVGGVWARSLSDLILSGVAMRNGRQAEAIAGLQRAESGFERSGMTLYLAATRRRRGELVGRPEGDRLIAEADGWLGDAGIRNVERFVAMLAPGWRHTT